MRTKLIIIIFSFSLFACSSPQTTTFAPVVEGWQTPQSTKGQHTVQKGETLYSIAFRYGYDFRELAKINDLGPDYALKPGQKLNLEKKLKKSTPQPIKIVSKTKTKIVAPTSVPATKVTAWQWPTKGKVVNRYASDKGSKGIDIAANLGAPVVATAGGKVVYSGSGLRGYGNLIIIKHTSEFLSAYAHNSKLLAKEGDWVKIGQKIALVGHSESKINKLHFEIRKSGKPVDPLVYLK